MRSEAYLEGLLDALSGSFDIYRSYRVGDKEYPAYGYYFSLSEKYVAVQKAQLWAVHAYEHIIVLQTQRCTSDTVREAETLIKDYIEPKLVRKGEKYPEKDHMVSDMTVVILSEDSPDRETVRAIKRYKFDRGYLFSFRGHSEGHIICVDLEREQVISGRVTKQMSNMLYKLFSGLEQSSDAEHL